MNLSKKKRILYSGIGIVLFSILIQAISSIIIWSYLSIMPFSHFVDIENIEAYNVAVGEQVQKFSIIRKARFDIDATSIKEVYRLDNGTPNQLYSIRESTFIYEKDGNGKELNFEITLNRPVERISEFYTIDKICLQLPKGIEKCDTLKIDWESYFKEKNILEIEISDLENIDELILKQE